MLRIVFCSDGPKQPHPARACPCRRFARQAAVFSGQRPTLLHFIVARFLPETVHGSAIVRVRSDRVLAVLMHRRRDLAVGVLSQVGLKRFPLFRRRHYRDPCVGWLVPCEWSIGILSAESRSSEMLVPERESCLFGHRELCQADMRACLHSQPFLSEISRREVPLFGCSFFRQRSIIGLWTCRDASDRARRRQCGAFGQRR